MGVHLRAGTPLSSAGVPSESSVEDSGRSWEEFLRTYDSRYEETHGLYFPDGSFFALGFWDQPSLLSKLRHSILKSLVARNWAGQVLRSQVHSQDLGARLRLILWPR